MKRPTQRRLASGELAILEMLWREGPVTLAAAHRALGQPIGYTTVQTRLNRLVKKGLASRSKARPAEYQAAVAPEEVSRDDLDMLLARVSGGSVVPLVAHLVQDRSLSPAELKELKRLIAEAERSARRGRREEQDK